MSILWIMFYPTGILAILWFIGWCWIVTESPTEHNSISQEELEHIQHSIGFTHQQVKVSPTSSMA